MPAVLSSGRAGATCLLKIFIENSYIDNLVPPLVHGTRNRNSIGNAIEEDMMKIRNCVVLVGLSLAALGTGLALKSFLPQRFDTTSWFEPHTSMSLDAASLPSIEITFLRCGSVFIPELLAVRGAASFAPRLIVHSAVLIRHPRAVFLYDTGLCSDIHDYLSGRSFFFRQTLAHFTLEQSISSHLRRHGLTPAQLDFVLLSHLHWDHVSGVPDLPGVTLRINRVEYEAARNGLFEQEKGLVRELLDNNPVELFDCAGPTYEGFRSSHDLLGDGSLMLLPLPGHTAGHTGLLINRANGPRVFLLGDAAWVAPNYQRPATMHPFLWSRVTADDATARQTLIQVHQFSLLHPEIALIAMHDGSQQELFEHAERTGKVHKLH
jgi:N-acyl homoserine lactone hydrolase